MLALLVTALPADCVLIAGWQPSLAVLLTLLAIRQRSSGFWHDKTPTYCRESLPRTCRSRVFGFCSNGYIIVEFGVMTSFGSSQQISATVASSATITWC